jgi:hypothetical protein
MNNTEILEQLEKHNLDIKTLKCVCRKCGSVWGINNEYNPSATRFICLACLEESINKKAQLNK